MSMCAPRLQVREDVTRFRYGDEQHLDEAMTRIFRCAAVWVFACGGAGVRERGERRGRR